MSLSDQLDTEQTILRMTILEVSSDSVIKSIAIIKAYLSMFQLIRMVDLKVCFVLPCKANFQLLEVLVVLEETF